MRERAKKRAKVMLFFELTKYFCVFLFFYTFLERKIDCLFFLLYLCSMKETVSYIISKLRYNYTEEEARELAYWIIEETTGITHSQIHIGASKKDIPNLQCILKQLSQHMPIQYIFGHTEWMGLTLKVNTATLIPRPETAELVEWVATTCDSNIPLSLLDIGTGTGCIAIALKKRCTKWDIQGVDISTEALDIAQKNAEKNKVNITWKRMDILTEIPDSIDIIVSNPPYICNKEKDDIAPRVLDHEPHTALFVPDDDPLLFYRRIASIKAAKYLFFEINEKYGIEVCDMLKELGYTNIQLKNDIYGKARMVFGRLAI